MSVGLLFCCYTEGCVESHDGFALGLCRCTSQLTCVFVTITYVSLYLFPALLSVSRAAAALIDLPLFCFCFTVSMLSCFITLLCSARVVHLLVARWI